MDANGFMGFWSDIDPEYRPRYREWHNCEHMPERVSIPGFIEGRRYRAALDGPTFFMCYVTQEPDVLSSAPYLAALNRPTPWTQEALTHFRSPERSLYRRLDTFGSISAHAPYITLVRFNTPQPQEELVRRLEGEFGTLPPGAGKVSLFDMNIHASRIMTAERAIYSAGPGERQFLISAEALLRNDAGAMGARIVEMLAPQGRDVHAGLYWLEIRIRAADVRSADTHRGNAT